MAEAAAPLSMVVHVAPPRDDPAGVEPFDALVRRTGDGRTILTATNGRRLPRLVAGQRLRVATDDDTTGTVVQVCGDYDGAANSVVVAPIPLAAAGARRSTPRVASSLLVALDVGEPVPRDGGLLDISRTGASIRHSGDALAPGAAGQLLVGVGGFAGNGRTSRITARVVWSQRHDDGSTTSGLRFDVGQSATVSRVLLEARRSGRTRRDDSRVQ